MYVSLFTPNNPDSPGSPNILQNLALAQDSLCVWCICIGTKLETDSGSKQVVNVFQVLQGMKQLGTGLVSDLYTSEEAYLDSL